MAVNMTNVSARCMILHDAHLYNKIAQNTQNDDPGFNNTRLALFGQ